MVCELVCLIFYSKIFFIHIIIHNNKSNIISNNKFNFPIKYEKSKQIKILLISMRVWFECTDVLLIFVFSRLHNGIYQCEICRCWSQDRNNLSYSIRVNRSRVFVRKLYRAAIGQQVRQGLHSHIGCYSCPTGRNKRTVFNANAAVLFRQSAGHVATCTPR